MFVKQISAFIENQPGRLAHFTGELGRANLDLIALSIADTTNFGILRAIVSDTERAAAVVREAGYTVNITDVIAVAVPDKPGGLAEVLAIMHDSGVSIEYLYSFVRTVNHKAVIIFRVDQPERGIEILTDKGIQVLGQDEIR